jgi:hypothetical protein
VATIFPLTPLATLLLGHAFHGHTKLKSCEEAMDAIADDTPTSHMHANTVFSVGSGLLPLLGLFQTARVGNLTEYVQYRSKLSGGAATSSAFNLMIVGK